MTWGSKLKKSSAFAALIVFDVIDKNKIVVFSDISSIQKPLEGITPTLWELILQVLQRPEAVEPPVDHDGEPRAQRLALLHAVWRQHDAAARQHRLAYTAPHQTLGGGVHAWDDVEVGFIFGRLLVEERWELGCS